MDIENELSSSIPAEHRKMYDAMKMNFDLVNRDGVKENVFRNGDDSLIAAYTVLALGEEYEATVILALRVLHTLSSVQRNMEVLCQVPYITVALENACKTETGAELAHEILKRIYSHDAPRVTSMADESVQNETQPTPVEPSGEQKENLKIPAIEPLTNNEQHKKNDSKTNVLKERQNDKDMINLSASFSKVTTDCKQPVRTNPGRPEAKKLGQSNAKNIVFYIEHFSADQHRQKITDILVGIRGVISIRFESNKRRCYLRINHDLDPEVAARAIKLGVGLDCSLVTREGGAEKMYKIEINWAEAKKHIVYDDKENEDDLGEGGKFAVRRTGVQEKKGGGSGGWWGWAKKVVGVEV